MGKLADDGFLIDFSAPNKILIIGPTDWGTEFGVCDFLERYVGVRWLMPGDDGRDVPAKATIIIPDNAVRDEPAFFSRLMSGWKGAAQSKWTRRMRMHGHISFHHNLLRLFPVETYRKTHPEFYPIRDGKRYFPPTNRAEGWQPCFTAEGIVEEAIKNIVVYFDEHPDRSSYSLGLNDSGGHCQCKKCLAADPGRKNILRYDHLSDRYFTWCNAVVKGVLKKHPDKWFGCLAYSEVFEPPDNVKVHERIIPYMTYGRMRWADPKLRAKGEALTRKWAKMSPTLGWYDYIYGTPYCLPRVWMHQMADYYRFGYKHGLRAMYAEAYPNFGEGPKLYVALKLQWNPNQEVNALLDEWYERCAGPEGAAYLRQYYEFWEDFWTRRIFKSDWYTTSGQYLPFKTAGYLADVSVKEIGQCRTWLETAAAKASTDKQKARVGLLLKAFEYYELSALVYPRTKAGKPIKTEKQALAAFEAIKARINMAAKRRHLSLVELAGHPVLRHSQTIDRSYDLRGDVWNAPQMWQVYRWLGRSDALQAAVKDLAQNAESQLIRDQANTMLSLTSGSLQNLAINSSCEKPDGWMLWVKWNTGKMTYTNKLSHAGKRSILCDGVKRGGPVQTVKNYKPGRYVAICFVYTPEGQESSGTIQLSLTARDKKQRAVYNCNWSTKIVPVPGQWQAVTVGGNVPAQYRGKDITSLKLSAIVNGFKQNDKIYIDDIGLFRLGDIEEGERE